MIKTILINFVFILSMLLTSYEEEIIVFGNEKRVIGVTS
jgi:hypothetical protein